MTVPDPLRPALSVPLVKALPKADLHLHQEVTARLDRLAAQGVAQRKERSAGAEQAVSPEGNERGPQRVPFDWRDWARSVIAGTPPGMARLEGIYEPDAMLDLNGLSDTDAEVFID